MGFSTVSSTGSQVMLRKSHHKSIEVNFVNKKRNPSSNFKLPKSKLQSGGIFMCKGEPIGLEERTSPSEVRKEIQKCYQLIGRLGRGVVYLGSSRMGPDHPHYVQTQELGKEANINVFDFFPQVATLLDCTSWSGAGPGLMDAATKGALQAGKRVGGFKIGREAGEWTASNFHPYLSSETYLTCRFFSARKHGLVDAAVRCTASDKTAVIALPGGIGTLDEMFEILALIQLERIGSELPVPFIVMNYDSFYSKLLDFLDECEDWGTVFKGEVASLWKVCNGNYEALEYLADFYNLPHLTMKHEAEVGTVS
ncbi:Cytokinin riboside 5'-monophosphate phosphoribohydrolase LOG [Macleaya cordata]|uniref:Cytokinin riboside 5'-monophosphate phosphoribohydrolase LOG n=1 Tax=Macleaya cordata TaxID=56857 RepID=A0A200RBG5_MACCD|nr:Cytokinin riboside 5'-monophosphate phosphoribohydrolase LOG [Macleaya cordata]